MKLLETSKLHGDVQIVLFDESGAVKDTRTITNLVVRTGLAFIISRMAGTAQNVMSHMAVGASATAAAPEDTQLLSQLGTRAAITSTTISGTNNEIVTYVATLGAGVGTGAVVEAGVFNASSGGTMLCRTTFGVVTKEAADTMQITWTITASAS